MKPFAWSYSKLKNFESCPKRHWHIDIQKDVKEEESDHLLWGNQVHKALADRIGKGVALPAGMERFEGWVASILGSDGRGDGALILVEQKLAINSSFGKTEFFAKDAWFRSVGDVVKLNAPVALIGDWKTGKILEDSQQLALSASCVFAHYPEIKKVRSEFFWLKEGPGVSTRADFTRQDIVRMWRGIWPRIEALRHAHETTSYPAKPGYLCRSWCPVRSCPHNGE